MFVQVEDFGQKKNKKDFLPQAALSTFLLAFSG